MGFSVSASTAIIFLAAFMSVGILYTGAYSGFEQVQHASQQKADASLARQNTAINVTSVTLDTTTSPNWVNVTVRNEGSTTLSVDGTDVLLNGTYATNVASQTITGDRGTLVAGSGGTDLWLPGEELTISIRRTMSTPIHVKVVTDHGVAATEVLP